MMTNATTNLGHIAQTAPVLGVCQDLYIKLLRENPALSLCFAFFIFAILDLMPATLNKVNAHAMLYGSFNLSNVS